MQSVIIRSLLEFSNKAGDFEARFNKKLFEGRFFSFVEKILKLEKISFQSFKAVLSEADLNSKEFLQIANSVPELDFLEYETPLKNDYMIRQQLEIAKKLEQAARDRILLNLDHLIDDYSDILESRFLTFTEWEEKIRKLPPLPKIKTGIDFLDHAFEGGLELAQLILISGDPEMGKTSIGVQILENVTRSNKVAFFCFEFTVRQYVNRKYNANFNKDNMFVLNDGFNINDVETNIKLLAKKGVKLFFIDSQMRVENTKEGNNPEERETFKFSTLARLCHKLEIIIIVIIQNSKSDSDNPLGSKRGAHEANVIMHFEKVLPDPKDIKNKNKPFLPDRRKFTMKKNKQNGLHFVEEVGFRQSDQTFHSIYEKDTSKKIEVDIDEIKAELNIDDAEPF